MSYSYGLSLINSHLGAGGTIVLTPYSFFTSEFWRTFDEADCTSFAGVPYMYEALDRVQFDPGRHRSLRAMTQAGGSLRREVAADFCRCTKACGARFFVMYGQTEATARIAYVPPEQLEQKIGAIGISVPGGHLDMAQVDELNAYELVYSGPNVMMGYADSASSLARGDELNGVLRTGDLVERDSEGFFYVTGRLNRFAKLLGRRISLSDVEDDLECNFPARVAVIEQGPRLRIFVEPRGDVDSGAVSAYVARNLRLPPKFIAVTAMDTIPLTPRGKKDYQALLPC